MKHKEDQSQIQLDISKEQLKQQQIDELKILLEKLKNQEKTIQQKFSDEKIIDQYSQKDKTTLKDLLDKAKYSVVQNEIQSFIELENQNIENLKKQQQGLHNPRFRNLDEMQPYNNLNPLDQILQKDKPIPYQYKDLYDPSQKIQNPLNIGQKMSNMINQSTNRKIALSKSLRQSRGQYIWQMFRFGKMGIDAYFLIFAFISLPLIPIYLYYQLQPHKNFVKNTLGITKENMPSTYFQDKYDLDEISIQKTYYNQFSKEIEKEKDRQISISKQKQDIKKKLEKI